MSTGIVTFIDDADFGPVQLTHGRPFDVHQRDAKALI